MMLCRAQGCHALIPHLLPLMQATVFVANPNAAGFSQAAALIWVTCIVHVSDLPQWQNVSSQIAIASVPPP